MQGLLWCTDKGFLSIQPTKQERLSSCCPVVSQKFQILVSDGAKVMCSELSELLSFHMDQRGQRPKFKDVAGYWKSPRSEDLLKSWIQTSYRICSLLNSVDTIIIKGTLQAGCCKRAGLPALFISPLQDPVLLSHIVV